jgi:hypothetical protein
MLCILNLDYNSKRFLCSYAMNSDFISGVRNYIVALGSLTLQFGYEDGKDVPVALNLYINTYMQEDILNFSKFIEAYGEKGKILETMNQHMQESDFNVSKLGLESVQRLADVRINRTRSSAVLREYAWGEKTHTVLEYLRWNMEKLSFYLNFTDILREPDKLSNPLYFIRRTVAIINKNTSASTSTNIKKLIEDIKGISGKLEDMNQIVGMQKSFGEFVQSLLESAERVSGVDNLSKVFFGKFSENGINSPVSAEEWEHCIDELDALGVYGFTMSLGSIVRDICSDFWVPDVSIPSTLAMEYKEAFNYIKHLIRSIDFTGEFDNDLQHI